MKQHDTDVLKAARLLVRHLRRSTERHELIRLLGLRPKVASDEQVEAVLILSESGMAKARIARATGLGRRTVHRLVSSQ